MVPWVQGVSRWMFNKWAASPVGGIEHRVKRGHAVGSRSDRVEAVCGKASYRLRVNYYRTCSLH